MLAEVVADLEHNPDQDFLGELFMALDLGNEWAGQFFTPVLRLPRNGHRVLRRRPQSKNRDTWLGLRE